MNQTVHELPLRVQLSTHHHDVLMITSRPVAKSPPPLKIRIVDSHIELMKSLKSKMASRSVQSAAKAVTPVTVKCADRVSESPSPENEPEKRPSKLVALSSEMKPKRKHKSSSSSAISSHASPEIQIQSKTSFTRKTSTVADSSVSGKALAKSIHEQSSTKSPSPGSRGATSPVSGSASAVQECSPVSLAKSVLLKEGGGGSQDNIVVKLKSLARSLRHNSASPVKSPTNSPVPTSKVTQPSTSFTEPAGSSPFAITKPIAGSKRSSPPPNCSSGIELPESKKQRMDNTEPNSHSGQHGTQSWKLSVPSPVLPPSPVPLMPRTERELSRNLRPQHSHRHQEVSVPQFSPVWGPRFFYPRHYIDDTRCLAPPPLFGRPPAPYGPQGHPLWHHPQYAHATPPHHVHTPLPPPHYMGRGPYDYSDHTRDMNNRYGPPHHYPGPPGGSGWYHNY